VGVSPVFAKANTEPLAGSGRPCLGMRCPVKKNKKKTNFFEEFFAEKSKLFVYVLWE
jgi:hypothetical protein